METAKLPRYEEAVECFKAIGVPISVSEGQGILAGCLCVNENYQMHTWVGLLFADEEQELDDALFADKSQAVLKQLFLATKQGFNNELDYPMLLPSEESALSVRTDQLGEWCHGFVSGLALSGCYINQGSKSESAEVLQDLIEISKVSAEDAAEEEQASAYDDVVKYVQGAVLLMHRALWVKNKNLESGIVTAH